MTIGIFDFIIGAIFWCLACVSVLVLMFPIVRAVDEIGIFGKKTSVLFAGGLFLLCFCGLLHLVTNNKTIQCIADKDNSLLLAELIIYASLAISLYIVTVLEFIVKTLKTKKENTDSN